MYTFGLVGTLLWFALMAIISTKESVIRKEIVLGKLIYVCMKRFQRELAICFTI